MLILAYLAKGDHEHLRLVAKSNKRQLRPTLMSSFPKQGVVGYLINGKQILSSFSIITTTGKASDGKKTVCYFR